MKSFAAINIFQTIIDPMNPIMNLFNIIGLNVSTTPGNSYETKSPNSNEILRDHFGIGITKRHNFTKYTLYITFENTYYAIHLSDCHIASSRGKLCTIGHMDVMPSNYEQVMTNITHIPLNPIDIDFQMKEYYYEEEFVYVYNVPNTCVFKFSKDGNDERTPSGFVYVNMDLFIQK